MKITISGNVIEGTPEELAEYFAMTEDFAKANTCEDACCEAVEDEIIEFEGEKYRKVDREAREGDVIILSQKQADKTTFVTAGTPYKVFVCGNTVAFVNDRGHTYDVYYRGFGRTPETVDVYEPIAASKPKYEPKVGDIVVITGDSEIAHVENEIGDIGKITKVDNDETAKVHVAGKRNEFNYVGFEDMRPATAEEIAQYEKAVADAEKRKAEEVKWAKLGRKVDEYKKGDIISYEYKAPIRYFIVTRIDGDRVYFNSRHFGNSEEYMPKNHPSIKLVAPVEATLMQN